MLDIFAYNAKSSARTLTERTLNIVTTKFSRDKLF